MPTLSFATAPLPKREVTPPNFRKWVEEDENPQARFSKVFSEWTAALTMGESMFKEHVYENPDLSEYDVRQHRLGLSFLLQFGESLIVDFLMDEKIEQAYLYKSLIDTKLAELRSTLHAWHGRPEAQTDLPASLIASMADVEAGRIVDMTVALEQDPEPIHAAQVG